MTHPGLLDERLKTAHSPCYILIIEDNTRLRSMLARYIMLNCDTLQQTCAIYHLDLQGVPRLTYSHRPDLTEGSVEDFIVLEADSPQRALSWLRRARLKQLTIISDVMMPADIEVGLSGLLKGLAQLQIALNLMFISSDPQNRDYVQMLLNGQPVFFLVKGSEAWRRLPRAIVEHANRFQYKPLAKLASTTLPDAIVPKEKPNDFIKVRPALSQPLVPAPIVRPAVVPDTQAWFSPWRRLWVWLATRFQ